MIATAKQEMLAEITDATGLPEDVVREIVAFALQESPGDVIEDGQENAPYHPGLGIFPIESNSLPVQQ